MLVWVILHGFDLVSYENMDFVSGKAEIDDEERAYVPPQPRNWVEKAWFAIA